VKKQLAAAIGILIALSSVLLVYLPHVPSVLAQYSWTDTINIYNDVSVVYTDIRRITNNETVSVDVRVYITFTEKIYLLNYYRLSANGTDFIIISGGEITLFNGTYYGLEPGQTLHFSVEAKGASSLSKDDVVKVEIRVEFWSLEYEHDVAVTNIDPSKTAVGQGYKMLINVTLQNQGNFTENFNVTAYANTTIIQTQTIADLTTGTPLNATFTWNTTGFAYGNYTISAVADIVPGETDTADNTYVDGWVIVTIAGDLTGDPSDPNPNIPDGDVDWFDFGVFATAYGTSKGDPNYMSEADFVGDPTDPDPNIPDGDIDWFDFGIFAKHYGQSI
jgi:hypothetical protein